MTAINFDFQLATSADIPKIVQLMSEAKAAMLHKEWFVNDDADYLQYVLDGHGFIFVAKPEHSEQLAGFFTVKFPGISEGNLGYHLNFTDEQLEKCVHMDSCVVHADFRGYHLQSRMASLAEQKLREMSYTYLFATIHPDNCYSMNSMLRCGYHIVKHTKLYGGLPRAIILKEI